MRVVKSIKGVKRIIASARRKGKTIGLVPTMGALHEGHLSLVRLARRKSDFVVVSVFVNPKQFEPHEDLRTYPRNLKKDLRLLKKEGADLVFAPAVRTMYPVDSKTTVKVRDLSLVLCGVSRPHHFEGVTTIVLKLFNIMQPDIAVFGKKDYQQAVVIQRMVKDLHLDIRIILGNTIREPDGLAMSSRNTYLSKRQRTNAVVLYESLQWLKKAYKEGLRNPKPALKKIRSMIQQRGGRLDYVEAIDKKTLMPVKKLCKGTLIAIAVYFGSTRLIDNTVL
jgi:pantoate--beta-alanine ligase